MKKDAFYLLLAIGFVSMLIVPGMGSAPPAYLPDLIIDSIWTEDYNGHTDIFDTSATVKCGEPFVIHYKVKNVGRIYVSSGTQISTTLKINGQLKGTDTLTLTSNLAVQGTYESIFSWSYDFWYSDQISRTVLLKVDDNPARVVEMNEGNNEKSGTLYNTPAKWSVIFYMSGGNSDSLDSQFTGDLDRIDNVGSNNDVSMAAIVDFSGSTTQAAYMGLNKRFEITLNKINASWGTELNMGQGNVLRDWGIYSFQRFKANNYALVLNGHASGGDSAFYDDGAGGDPLYNYELRDAFNSIKQSVQLTKIDLVVLYSCSLATIDRLEELSPHVNVMVTSEDYSLHTHMIGDDHTMHWDHALSPLIASPNMGEARFGTTIASEYMNEYSIYPAKPTTMSVFNLNNSMQLEGMVQALSKRILIMWDPVVTLTNIMNARQNTQQFDKDLADLRDFANELKIRSSDSEIVTYCTNIYNFLAVKGYASDAFIIYNGQDDEAGAAYGVSIWFPEDHPNYKYWLSWRIGNALLGSESFYLNTQWEDVFRMFCGGVHSWLLKSKTVPDGHYISYTDVQSYWTSASSAAGPGFRANTNGSSDYGYFFGGYAAYHQGGSTILTVEGYFSYFDTFTSDLWEGRRYLSVRVYSTSWSLVSELNLLNPYDHNTNTWYYSIATFGNIPANTDYYVVIGRGDGWSNDWRLSANCAGVSIITQ